MLRAAARRAVAVAALIATLEAAWAVDVDALPLLGYPSLRTVNASLWRFLNDSAADFSVQTAAVSVEGRIVTAVCMGRCGAGGEPAPATLVTGLIHAREPMSLLAVLAAVRLLASASPQGAELGPLLRTRSFYFVPVSDPDGYAANAASAAGGNSLPLHRKNMRPTCPHAKAATGVDLNRNFPTCFEGDKHGASANPCAEDYRGPSALSEPESRGLDAFVASLRPRLRTALSLHAFGASVNLPFACQPLGHAGTADQWAAFQRLGHAYTAGCGYSYGSPWGAGGALYTVSGDFADHMWRAHGVYAASPELAPGPAAPDRPGFYPDPHAAGRGTAREILPAILAAADAAATLLNVTHVRVGPSSAGDNARPAPGTHGHPPSTTSAHPTLLWADWVSADDGPQPPLRCGAAPGPPTHLRATAATLPLRVLAAAGGVGSAPSAVAAVHLALALPLSSPLAQEAACRALADPSTLPTGVAVRFRHIQGAGHYAAAAAAAARAKTGLAPGATLRTPPYVPAQGLDSAGEWDAADAAAAPPLLAAPYALAVLRRADGAGASCTRAGRGEGGPAPWSVTVHEGGRNATDGAAIASLALTDAGDCRATLHAWPAPGEEGRVLGATLLPAEACAAVGLTASAVAQCKQLLPGPSTAHPAAEPHPPWRAAAAALAVTTVGMMVAFALRRRLARAAVPVSGRGQAWARYQPVDPASAADGDSAHGGVEMAPAAE